MKKNEKKPLSFFNPADRYFKERDEGPVRLFFSIFYSRGFYSLEFKFFKKRAEEKQKNIKE
jgi:hypothetical protein